MGTHETPNAEAPQDPSGRAQQAASAAAETASPESTRESRSTRLPWPPPENLRFECIYCEGHSRGRRSEGLRNETIKDVELSDPALPGPRILRRELTCLVCNEEFDLFIDEEGGVRIEDRYGGNNGHNVRTYSAADAAGGWRTN